MKNIFKRKLNQLKLNMLSNRNKEIINRVENKKEHNIFILQIKTLMKWFLSFFKKKEELIVDNCKLNGEIDIVGRVRNELENTIDRLIILKHELEYGLTKEQRKNINHNHNRTIKRFKELIDYSPILYNNSKTNN